MDGDNIPNGIGREIYNNGSVYEGQLQNGLANGWGREIYKSGRYYIGCWKAGDYHGFGQRFEANGDLIEKGWFKESKVVDDQFSISTIHYNRHKRPEEYPPEQAKLARTDINFMDYTSFYGKMYKRRSNSRGYRAVE